MKYIYLNKHIFYLAHKIYDITFIWVIQLAINIKNSVFLFENQGSKATHDKIRTWALTLFTVIQTQMGWLTSYGKSSRLQLKGAAML